MTILSAVVLLGILIFVHELGHFLFAKLAKVKVLKFSLGFGPKVVGRQYGETEYLVSAVPLGGYVKMLGEEAGDEIPEEDRPRAYNNQPVWKRMLIVFSGPLFNIVFAALVFALIFLKGVPVAQPYVGKITEDSPAAGAGLLTGDRITALNGTAVNDWEEIEVVLSKNRGEVLLFTVLRGDKTVAVAVKPVRKVEKNIFGQDEEIWDVGVSPLLHPDIGEVVKDSRAYKAGLMKGDRIVEIGGTAIETWQDVTGIIHKSPEKPLKMRVKRGGESIEIMVTPEKETLTTPAGEKKEIGLIGIKYARNDLIKTFGLGESFIMGVEKTWDISVLTLVSIVKLIQRIIPAQTIGGPILIFQMAGEQAAQGPLSFFTFMAVISINLGVLNLLPIPILDGGHMVFLGIEAVRRKPLNEKVIMVAQRAGLVIIITLMVFAFYNDIMRLVTGKMIPQ